MMTAGVGTARAGSVRRAIRSGRSTLRIAALLLLSILGTPAMAHKLQVFAFAEGTRISGSAYFAGGGAASGSRIEVSDAEGRLLAELTPDDEGKFVYPAQVPVDHLIRAITGDGHQAEWLVPAAELAPGFGFDGSVVEGIEGTHRSTPSGIGATEASSTPASPMATLDPALEAAIERAVARQIRPLREQLVAAEDRIRLQDILGGIGFIMGLTGLALWLTRRRHSGPP
jgi:nickel transport protein